ncbi:MAG: alpha-L-fucosidase [Anaerocolumna sp.]|jgi:alpha-L-fucosidase 2|nr:alpha-L-fucosidase [Anaerocolumna sp.]
MKLWYKQPATVFEEALPIGNGRLGGMVYGGIKKERISLNDDTLWSGYPIDKSDEKAYPYLDQVRDAIDKNEKNKAQELLWKHMLSTWTESYQPVGNFILTMQHDEKAENYRRELDIENAVATTSYTADGTEYERTAFCSYPDNLMVLHIRGDRKGQVSLEAYLESLHPCNISTAQLEKGELLLLEGKAPVYAAPSYHGTPEPLLYELEGQTGLSFGTGVLPIVSGGECRYEEGRIIIQKADSVTFIINTATNYDGMGTVPKDSRIDCRQLLLSRFEKLASLDMLVLYETHVKDYHSLYNRVSLKIAGDNKEHLPLDERLKAYEWDKDDYGLISLIFQYGRYLLISSSRTGSQPANLQGIWNEHLRAPWSSNYTLNINAEMNYWSAENTNLSECHEPLLVYIKGLAKNGARTAKKNYNSRGWCAHHNSDLWGQTEAVGKLSLDTDCVCYAFWPHGGSWLTRHIWEHYEYTKDREFLREYREIIYGAAEFLLDYAVERDGRILLYPTTSPENTYIENGEKIAVCADSAMDIGMYKDVLGMCAVVTDIFIEKEELKNRCLSMLGKLPEYKVGSKGQLLEWDKEYEEAESLHRHLSLLYGFYPANSINHQETKELIPAVINTMNLRGDEATGWGIAWKICVWARLRDGEHTKKVLDNAIRFVDIHDKSHTAGGGVYLNLLGAHPPFQIDSNFGITAGITEMLVQSHEGDIELLPALPLEWGTGEVTGLCARGGLEISISWEEGSLKEALLKAKTEFTGNVSWEEKCININLKQGEIYKIVGA